jgi:hypothetical protein
MATYVKTTSSGLSWTNTTAWSQTPATGYPGTNGAADEAQWTSATGATATNVTGITTTVGKFTVSNTAVAHSTGGVAGTITLDPTSFGGIGIELTSAAAFNFTLGSLTALGSSQTWRVASGRTLTVSGAVSGSAKDLTLDGAGTKTFSAASTGWTGSTVMTAAGQTNISNANGLGAATNAVVVNSDANLSVSAAIVNTSITVNGDGFTGGTGYGAF